MKKDPYAALELDANKSQAERQQRFNERLERVYRWVLLDTAWTNIYVPMPMPNSGRGINYREWGQRLAAFCEQAKRGGFADLFVPAGCTDTDTLNALAMLRAGLHGGEAAIALKMTELQSGWMRVFNRYELSEFLNALKPPPPPAKLEAPPVEPRPSAKAPKLKTTIPPNKRTCPVSLRRAAKLLGKTGSPKDAAEWLRASIDDGCYQAEQISRQNWVFNIDAFPEKVHTLITPQVAVTGGKRR